MLARALQYVSTLLTWLPYLVSSRIIDRDSMFNLRIKRKTFNSLEKLLCKLFLSIFLHYQP